MNSHLSNDPQKPSTVITLDGTITLHVFEIIANRTFSHNKILDCVTFNMSDLEFIDAGTLIYILSIFSHRFKQGLKTFLILPKSKNVRDYFRSWMFDKAFEPICGVLFKNIVSREDWGYFGENPDARYQKYAGPLLLDLHDSWDRLIENYLPITVFSRKYSSFDVNMAFKEADRWKKQVISTILGKYLTGPYAYFASRIVFEAIMNAVRHPNASVIATASQKYDIPRPFFHLHWWDDGKSIISTLRETLEKEKKLRAEESSIIIDLYRVVYFDSNQCREEYEFRSDYCPKQDTPDHILLLLSIFPGITCDLKGVSHVPPPEISTNPVLSLPGMGLYLLVNAACDIYGGMVIIRTNEYKMEIQSVINQKHKYVVRIYKVSESYKINGNMLSISLPLGA